MGLYLSVDAVEKSTYIVTVSFQDEEGTAIVPATPVLWKLTDAAGNAIVNGSVPAATVVDIVLTGEALAIAESEHRDANRNIIVETSYDSSSGMGLALVGSTRFKISNIFTV